MGNSTCHGMHYCFDAKFRIQRFVWTILVLASLIFLAKQVYDGALKYMAYPFTTTTTLVYSSQVKNRPLPAIAICNRNDFRYGLTLIHIFNFCLLFLSEDMEEYGKNTSFSRNFRLLCTGGRDAQQT